MLLKSSFCIDQISETQLDIGDENDKKSLISHGSKVQNVQITLSLFKY